MLKDSKNKSKKTLTLDDIQKYFTYFLLFTLPLAIIPFPWDWTEKGMSLLILSVVTIVLGIEVIKLIWKGKISILKSTLDIGLLAILFSMLISTLFSVDFYSSWWGIDARLGGGLLVFIAILIFAYVSRNYLHTWDDVKKCILAFLFGFGISNILSLLSFFGVNIWNFMPVFRDLHKEGLPLLRSAKVHVFANLINITLIIGLYLSSLLNNKKNKKHFLLSILLIFSIFNVIAYSINQGFDIVICFVILLITFFSIFAFKIKNLKKERNTILTVCIITLLFLLLPTSLLQIESIREIVIPPNLELVTQLTLGSDISWTVAASVFVDSLWRGLVGLGVDTYSVAYNQFRPINQSLLGLNNVNFNYASNEIFTNFANCGLIWLLSWFYFGFRIFKLISKNFNDLSKKDNLDLIVFLFFIDFVILFIFVSSLFVNFSILIVFLLLFLISLEVVLRNILKKGNEDKFIIKIWTLDINSENNEKSVYNVKIFFTVISVLIMCVLNCYWGSKLISSAYLLKTESFLIEQSSNYTNENLPTTDQKDSFISSMLFFYSKAAKYDNDNPLINRKYGLMYFEKMNIIAEKYSGLKDDQQDEADLLIKDLNTLKNYALDISKESVDTSSYIYDNWEIRSQIGIGLLGLGFKDYSIDTLSILDKAIYLKPSNYELYYSKAQVYILNNDKDNALLSLSEVFSINPQHVPSLLLAAEISKDNGDFEVYKSYLKAAKKVLETVSMTESEVYLYITKQLNDIPEVSDIDNQSSESENTEAENTNENSESTDTEVNTDQDL